MAPKHLLDRDQEEKIVPYSHDCVEQSLTVSDVQQIIDEHVGKEGFAF